MTPFDIEIKTTGGENVIRIKRNVAFLLSTVKVFDAHNQLVGRFKQKFFSIGGKFHVLDTNNNLLCKLKGKWTSWDFKFMKDKTELAHVSKKWSSIGKELFTSADNYMLTISNHVPKDAAVRMLILAAVMCIDMVLKE